MPTVQDLRDLARSLTSAERLALRAELVRIDGAVVGIEKTPGVQGGAACVVRSRVPVWLLEASRRAGMTEAQLLANYPSLTPSDLMNAWAYVDLHRDEIEREILSQEQDAD